MLPSSRAYIDIVILLTLPFSLHFTTPVFLSFANRVSECWDLHPSALARAIGEVGRIAKTLYLLSYIDDDNYRRRILTQLNRGEGRHAVARVIFHGQRGELRQRYQEGQEDQLGALGLVLNAVILWNTTYMQDALEDVRGAGKDVLDADIARLSPLVSQHINFSGTYHFNLPESLSTGQHRPLRTPDRPDEES